VLGSWGLALGSRGGGVELAKHPSGDKLQNCHSSEDVLQPLLEREMAFQVYRDKRPKLLDCLAP